METKMSQLFDDLSVDETLEIDGGTFPLIDLKLPAPNIYRILYGINIVFRAYPNVTWIQITYSTTGNK